MQRNRLPKVRIVKVGTLCCEASEIAGISHQIKSELGIGGGSTVTLIEAEQRILVDTGFDNEGLNTPSNNEKNATNLVRALQDLGITPKDIDAVFITHWHRDHFGNLSIFDRAEHLASKGVVERFGLGNCQGLDDKEEIAEGVKVILTPGHTIDHASLIVDTRLANLKARVAIAGDAIVSHSYYQSGRIWQYNADFHTVKAARESVLRLVSLSDIIVPGHGGPFMV